MRVIICGGADVTEDADGPLAAALDALHARRRFTVVGLRSEAGDSADILADVWSDTRGIDRIVFPPTAGRGAYADHDRNRLMLTVLRPELVVVLPGGADTTNLVHQARRTKVAVVEIDPAAGQDTGDPSGQSLAPISGERGRPAASRLARAGRQAGD